jgi:hypothetical protein
MKHVFLIDVSRHIGLAQHVVNAAQAYASKFQPELIEWFVKPAQAQALDGAQIHRVTYGVSPWLTIKSRIDELSGNGSVDRVFHVLSYDGQVLGEATKSSGPSLAVTSLSLSTLTKSSPSVASGGVFSPVDSRPSAGSISLPEAIELTKKVLAERGYDSPQRPLKQLFLRRLLSDRDARARKNPYDPASVSLISYIVSEGLSRGWLGRSRRDNRTGTEQIWLIRTDASRGAEPTAISNPPAAYPPGILNTVEPARATSEPTESITPSPAVEKGHGRTTQMQQCLKNRYIYSPKLIWNYIFSTLHSQSNKLCTNPVTVSQLLREARIKAEQVATSEGVKFDFWPSASDGVLENLVAAGALLDAQGTSIKPGPHARGTKVYGLQTDFEDCCEAYLLEYLITALGDVTWPRDRTAIAHALFKVGPSRKEVYELQERVDELLVRLRDRVIEKEGGKLVVER